MTFQKWFGFWMKFQLTWELKSPCWGEEACNWVHTETLLTACQASRTLSTAADPHPRGGALAARGWARQTVALPPLLTPANVLKDSHPRPGKETHTTMLFCKQSVFVDQIVNSFVQNFIIWNWHFGVISIYHRPSYSKAPCYQSCCRISSIWTSPGLL